VLLDDQIYFRLSLRMVTGFVQSLIQLSGLSWKHRIITHFSSNRHFSDEAWLLTV